MSTYHEIEMDSNINTNDIELQSPNATNTTNK